MRLPIWCRKDHWQRGLIPPAIDWKASKTRPSRDPDNLISTGIFWHVIADHLFPDKIVWIFYHITKGLFPCSSCLFETSPRHPIWEISHWNEGIIYGWRSWYDVVFNVRDGTRLTRKTPGEVDNENCSTASSAAETNGSILSLIS